MTPDEDVAREAPPTFLSEPIEAYLAPLLEDLASYEAQASIPTALAAALAERYTIQGELGHGGMATVYLAFDKRLARSVAVKVLSAPLAGNLSAERFAREVEITAELQHDRIVSVHDRGAVAGLLYYVMRHFECGSLRDRIARDGPLTIESTIAIARDVAAALDFAHARGIVHRDIKPENILLEGDTAFLADFGVARLIDAADRDRLTQTGAVLGTAQYMSPEQAGSERNIDSRSDIYSLGCVVFEMLAGDPPFTSSSAKVILARQMHERPPRLSIIRPTVTPELEQAVDRALAKQRSDRFESATAFVNELSRSASGVTARSRRIRRRVLIAGALTLVAASSGWGLKTIATREPDPAAADASRRIAVLYFEDLTPERRLAHVAAGLTEDLIDELSRVRALRVISPNGVQMLRDSSLPPNVIAERLDVGTLITGSVASSASLVRLTVRLIDPRNGIQLNSRTIERPTWDLLTLQDSLTSEVALWLREGLGATIRPRQQRQSTTSVEAWEAVQRGEALLNEGAALVRSADTGSRVLLRRADSAFALAERHDGKWVVPTVGRARTALVLAFAEDESHTSSGFVDRVFVSRVQRAVAHTERALERDPAAPEALSVRGEARLRLGMFGVPDERTTSLALAERDLQQAASARPDYAHAWSILGQVYSEQARFAEAADAYETAYETDAFLTEIRAVVSSLFGSSLDAERFDDAQRWCAMGKRRFPGDPRFIECDLRLLGATGNRREDASRGWQIIEQIEREDSVGMFAATWSFRRMMVAAILARAGLRDSAMAVIARTEAQRGRQPDAYAAEAYVRVLLNDRGGALSRLQRLIVSQRADRLWISRSPWYRDLHSDPEFRALIHEPISDSRSPH